MLGSRLALTDPAPSIRHTDIDEGSIQRPRSLPPQVVWPSDGSGTLNLSCPDYSSQMNTGTQYSTSRPPSNLTNTRMPTIRCVDCESQSGSQSQSHGPRTTTPAPSVGAVENPNPDRRENNNEYLQPPHEPLQKPSISSIGAQSATRPGPASTSASKISLSSEIGQTGFGPQQQRGHEAGAAAAAAPTLVQRNTESTRSSTGTFRFYEQLNQNQTLNQSLNQDRDQNQNSVAGNNAHGQTETDMADHKNKEKSSMRRMYQRIVQSTSTTLTGEKQKKALRRISVGVIFFDPSFHYCVRWVID